VVRNIDVVGRLDRNAYDTLGNQTFDVSAITAVVRNAYDGAGRLTSITDRLNRVREFTYVERQVTD
jgi:YD repeat-containing protein